MDMSNPHPYMFVRQQECSLFSRNDFRRVLEVHFAFKTHCILVKTNTSLEFHKELCQL